MTDYQKQRRHMVETQLKPRGINEPRVLRAMGEVPREKFVPEKQRPQAYSDGAMSIGHGQTISQPYMVALMTQSLQLTGDERVLEVGSGSGYQAAVLAQLAEEVFTVERIAPLSEMARSVLEEKLRLDNVYFKVGDGTKGWEEKAPFDRIIVTAAAPEVPKALVEQLRRGGKMVAPIGSAYSQMLTRIEKTERGHCREQDICRCVFVKLVGENGW